jgi:predicted pyridoxine 5'-phosphate oxidase superfamily flavin-nucleotide-binding protein
MSETPEAQARRIVAENDYLTLATAGVDGSPWASPVWFAARGLDLFVWASKPGARHSRNIAENPRVSFAIFDSTCAPGEGTAVYVAADARLVEPAEFDETLAVYNAGSLARGLPAWSAEQLTAPARHRLYAAVAHEVFVLDDHDERVPVRV